MMSEPTIAVMGTFDSKGEEHEFLKKAIEGRGGSALTINVGTQSPSTFKADIDLFEELLAGDGRHPGDRDKAFVKIIDRGRALVKELHREGKLSGIVSAGGGSGTHLCTSIMKVLPMGLPKVMVSTVAARDMSRVVGTRDITMMHSVVDLLGVNSISGSVLDQAAGACLGMAKAFWEPPTKRMRIALSFFGFITPAAEACREYLEEMGYEVIAFHSNGMGGMAMEELVNDGVFEGILDLSTHELADALMSGYCGNIGPERFEPPTNGSRPRLVIPGGMDCAVLEFTRDTIPEKYKGQGIFFYDFRSAVRLSKDESVILANQLASKLNKGADHVKVLIPTEGWSAADIEGGPLYNPEISQAFIDEFTKGLDPSIEVREAKVHINDPEFARAAAVMMDQMIKNPNHSGSDNQDS